MNWQPSSEPEENFQDVGMRCWCGRKLLAGKTRYACEGCGKSDAESTDADECECDSEQ